MELPQQLQNYLTHLGLTQAGHCLIAFSGGLDSTALLLAMHALNMPHLRVAHVHHGLHAGADQWAAHCQSLCQRLSLPIDVLRVNCQARQGEGLEAAARHARYQALAELVQPGEFLLTAHHRQDQAETLLLQLFRGTGLDGLLAMPDKRIFAAGWHLRPLLDCEREDLRQFVLAQGVDWIEDPANQSDDFRRNRLRHHLLPTIAKLGWPTVVTSLARCADNLRDAKSVVDEVALQDWQICRDPQGHLRRSALNTLSAARQRHVLRQAMRTHGLALPGRDMLESLRLRLLSRQTGKTLEWAGGRFWLHGDQARLLPPLATRRATAQAQHWRPADGPCLGWRAMLAEQAPAEGSYYDLDVRFYDQALQLRFRQGGEQYLSRQGQRRSLKKALQELGVPPSERAGVPLLYDAEGTLLAVLGYFVCEPGLPADAQARVMRIIGFPAEAASAYPDFAG